MDVVHTSARKSRTVPVRHRRAVLPILAKSDPQRAALRRILRRTATPYSNIGGSAAPPIVDHVLASNGGRPLEGSVRRYFEPRFSRRFNDVRIHTGAAADASAQAIQARAYTYGTDVVFRNGAYAPDTTAGRRILAHELAHVVQQSGRGAQRVHCKSSLSIGRSNDAAEAEADRAANRILAGGVATGLSRQSPQVPHQIRRVCGPYSRPYSVASNDTGTSIAAAHNISLACLQRANPGVNWGSLQIGQSLNVPTGTCSVAVPRSADEQVVAGGVFAEALQSRRSNDERNAVASTFVNRVDHVTRLCNGSICTSLSAAARTRQCRSDTRNFGANLAAAVSTGSAAHGGGQWRKVMSGNRMRTSRQICRRIRPGELVPLLRAIRAARTMVGIVGRRRFVAFNQAPNTPPSTRMERVTRIGAHTFYRFRSGHECG